MNYRRIHNIGLSIIIIGLINIYNIIKYGIIIYIGGGGIIINISIIKILIIISLGILIFFNFIKEDNIKEDNIKEDKRKKIEYEITIGLSLIGIIFILISNDFIMLYLGLECYNFAIVILILVKETYNIRRIAIIYLILSSLTSGIILISVAYIYKSIGINTFQDLIKVLKISPLPIIKENYNIIKENIEIWKQIEEEIKITIWAINISIIYKLGIGPFIYWIIRVYSEIDKRILWYQLIIPKLIFFILLIKFSNFILFFNSKIYIYILLIISIISIIYSSIGGLFQTKDNNILTYSSIINIGYILLSLSIILYNNIDKDIYIHNNNIWIIFQYFFIYFINLLGIFSIIFLYYRSSNINTYITFYKNPYFFSSFIIIIFSFIGIPPFSGFIGKLHLLLNYITKNNNLSIIIFIIFICSSLISSFFYFKLLFPSTFYLIPNFFYFSKNYLLISNEPIYPSFLLSFSTIFTIFYPFFLSSFYPLFFFFFN